MKILFLIRVLVLRKSVENNLEMMRNLDTLVSLGYPVLLATSRKSTIGHVLDLPTS